MQLAASNANEYSIKCDVCGATFTIPKNYCTVDYEKKLIFSDFLCFCGHKQKSVSFNIGTPIQRDDANIKRGGNIWISGMKVGAGIAFFVIISCGISLASLGRNAAVGALIIVGSVVVAFLSVAMLMIFLNLAQDVSKLTQDTSEIKQLLRKIRSVKMQS